MMDIENGGQVRVLTVRQPHAHLLIHGSPSAGVKDVENRSKPTGYRGTLLIQASAKVDRAAYAGYIGGGVELPSAGVLVTGAMHRPAALKAGQDLTIEVTRWQADGKLSVDANVTPAVMGPARVLAGQILSLGSQTYLG